MQSYEDFNGTRKYPLPAGYRGDTRRELPEVFSGYTAVILWTSMAAFILSLIVLAAPGWASAKMPDVDDPSKTNSSSITMYSGLFVTKCAKRTGPRSPGWAKAAQAMVLLAFFGSVLAFAAGTCYLFVDAWSKKYFIYAFTAGSAFAAFFMFLGFIVFAAKLESKYTLTYGFAFAVINFIVSIAAAVAGILQMRKKGMLPRLPNQIKSLL